MIFINYLVLFFNVVLQLYFQELSKLFKHI